MCEQLDGMWRYQRVADWYQVFRENTPTGVPAEVARCFPYNGEPAEANARLIAAAKELLSVARSVAARGYHEMPDGMGPCKCSQCDLVREARATVAKATGD